jgi:hypothetical protein
VLSFPFQLRFLFASYPDVMGTVLGIVYRTLSTHIIHKAGFTKSTAHTGAATLIQRWGSALNLNVHFHMLYLDGVFAEDAYGKTRFHRIKAPTTDELGLLAHRISQRVAKFLERRGFLERDDENSYLALEAAEDDPMQQLYGHSITYRIAIGPHQGRKVFTLQSLPPVEEPKEGSSRVANVAGLLRASCPPPFGPAFGCSKSLPAIFSAYMPGSWQKRINGTNSNDCAVTLPGRRYQSNAYHSLMTDEYAMSLRRPIGTAPPM